MQVYYHLRYNMSKNEKFVINFLIVNFVWMINVGKESAIKISETAVITEIEYIVGMEDFWFKSKIKSVGHHLLDGFTNTWGENEE